jgi:hypothetical protein
LGNTAGIVVGSYGSEAKEARSGTYANTYQAITARTAKSYPPVIRTNPLRNIVIAVTFSHYQALGISGLGIRMPVVGYTTDSAVLIV